MHRRPYRDTSFLLDVLTPTYGRLCLIARGAKKSKAGGLLQSLQPLKIDFSQHGDLGNLQRYEAAGSALALQSLSLWSGFYLNELLMRLVAPGEVHSEQLFDLYSRALRNLREQAPAIVLRRFEHELLGLLGYALDFEVLQARQGCRLAWSPERGLVEDARGVACEALLALVAGADDRRILPTQSFLASMLEPLLGGRPLRTGVMLRDLVGLRQQAEDRGGAAARASKQ